MKNLIILFVFLVFTISFISCGKKEESKLQTEKKNETISPGNISEIQKKGKEFFYMESKENGLKCADCHSDGTNDSNPFIKNFPDLKGANKRLSTYSGKFTGEDVNKSAAGAQFCLEKFLLIKTPLSADDIAGLNAYYEYIAKGNEPNEIKYENIALPGPDKTKLKEEKSKVMALTGDLKKGEEVFKRACEFCHGDNSKITHVPKLFEEFDGDAGGVTFMVRFGKKFMPFYSLDKLTSQDIADVSAFIISKVKK